MRFLLTGISGYVGKQLGRAILEEGHVLYGLSRNLNFTSKKQLFENSNFTYIQHDIIHNICIANKIDIIIHAAAQSPWNMTSIDQYIDSNIAGILNVRQLALNKKVKLVIFLSSVSVYGASSELIDENSPIINPDMYGITKNLGEKILLDISSVIPIIILRLPAVLGKGFNVSWISNIVKKAIRNENINIFNTASLFNNVVGISDLTNFIFSLTQQRLKGNHLVNLASSCPVSIGNIADLVVNKTKSKSEIITEKDVSKTSFMISIDKAQKEYNYIPTTTTETIKKFIKQNINEKKNK